MEKNNSNSKFQLPSLDDLLSWNILDDNINIEDELATQDDENLFLIASMAFLQRHLKCKLEKQNREKDPKRSYSDLLLFTNSSTGKDEKFYIRLKDSDKFDEIKKSEISLPGTALSSDQILPTAKKQKSRFTEMFRRKSNNVKQCEHKRSIFDMFKKKPKEPKNIKCYLSVHTDISSNVNEVVVRSSESTAYQSYSSTSSLWSRNINFKCEQSNSSRTKYNMNEDFRTNTTLNSMVLNNCDDFEGDSEVYTDYCKYKSKLPKQQSKLSVCMEDESESECELVGKPSLSYTNFPDELKANLPPQVLNNIINDMIYSLENQPD